MTGAPRRHTARPRSPRTAGGAWSRWRCPPLALDTKIFAGYEQLKRFFYVFLLKTPFAESVLATGDMAFSSGCGRTGPPATTRAQIAAGSRMEVIEGTGHSPHVEKPDEVNDRILAWVTA